MAIEIGRCIVEKKYRGSGIMESAANVVLPIISSQLCVDKVFLSVKYDNEIAIKTYEKIGFVVIKSDGNRVEMERNFSLDI